MGQSFREFAFTRKQIRKALVLLFKKFCKRYCRGMGFCGKHCSRGREDFDFLGAADDIAASEFFYRSSDANVSVLRNLPNFIRFEGITHCLGSGGMTLMSTGSMMFYDVIPHLRLNIL